MRKKQQTNALDLKWDKMCMECFFDEVETFLKVEADKVIPPESPWEEATENPKLRYNRSAKVWYRRCCRCPYEQASTGFELPTAMHKCDGVLIIWPKKIADSKWRQ